MKKHVRRAVMLLGLPGMWLLTGCTNLTTGPAGAAAPLYVVDIPVESRSISAENPRGEKGAGGQAVNHLGVGRKGAPNHALKPGETYVLCDIRGPATIRHIWMGGSYKTHPISLRGIVLRAYWEDQAHPGIECPLGDFMGLPHARIVAYQSAAHSVSTSGGMNFWLPMPFRKRGRITLTNESEHTIHLWYQVDYTINDPLPETFGRLHAAFRRENPTTLERDFVILEKREGMGRYVGAVIGVRSLDTRHWWGEGEIKIYLDGDEAFPTICGTGSEDYVGLAYGVQETPYRFHGCFLNREGYVSMYRWHLPDPIYWKKDIRITIQQIGWGPPELSGTQDSGLYERRDDWSCAAFWYEPVPSAPLPPLPDLAARTADLE